MPSQPNYFNHLNHQPQVIKSLPSLRRLVVPPDVLSYDTAPSPDLDQILRSSPSFRQPSPHTSNPGPIPDPRQPPPLLPAPTAEDVRGQQGGEVGGAPLVVGEEPSAPPPPLRLEPSLAPSRSMRGGLKGSVSFARGTRGDHDEQEEENQAEERNEVEAESPREGCGFQGEAKPPRLGVPPELRSTRPSISPFSFENAMKGAGIGKDGGQRPVETNNDRCRGGDGDGDEGGRPHRRPQVLETRPSLAASFGARLTLEVPSTPQAGGGGGGGGGGGSVAGETSFGSPAAISGTPSAAAPLPAGEAPLPLGFELFSRRPMVPVLDTPSDLMVLDPDKLHEHRQCIEVRLGIASY